mmetsp:Transcript_5961/g.16679  ORF Transcript_5961/g.16679 Transcript_5961/m.16679 type:complete len:489 (+) Transcript_5961:646-2112(+)
MRQLRVLGILEHRGIPWGCCVLLHRGRGRGALHSRLRQPRELLDHFLEVLQLPADPCRLGARQLVALGLLLLPSLLLGGGLLDLRHRKVLLQALLLHDLAPGHLPARLRGQRRPPLRRDRVLLLALGLRLGAHLLPLLLALLHRLAHLLHLGALRRILLVLLRRLLHRGELQRNELFRLLPDGLDDRDLLVGALLGLLLLLLRKDRLLALHLLLPCLELGRELLLFARLLGAEALHLVLLLLGEFLQHLTLLHLGEGSVLRAEVLLELGLAGLNLAAPALELRRHALLGLAQLAIHGGVDASLLGALLFLLLPLKLFLLLADGFELLTALRFDALAHVLDLLAALLLALAKRFRVLRARLLTHQRAHRLLDLRKVPLPKLELPLQVRLFEARKHVPLDGGALHVVLGVKVVEGLGTLLRARALRCERLGELDACVRLRVHDGVEALAKQRHALAVLVREQRGRLLAVALSQDVLDGGLDDALGYETRA